jgi:hypothetical protein
MGIYLFVYTGQPEIMADGVATVRLKKSLKALNAQIAASKSPPVPTRQYVNPRCTE